MNGFYNVKKEEGWSSSDLVVVIRGILRRKTGQKYKVGHLGTLDPLATGVLGVAVGSATKLFDYFLKKKKTYVATCVLGKSTDTLDKGGVVVEEASVPFIETERIKEVLHSFVGESEQVPPQYSAKSVGGVRAYKLAHKGALADLKACKITIYECEFLERIAENAFKFRVECSGGTYIRSLCRDIGKKLSLPSFMGSLVRIKNGMMKLEDAASLEEIEQDIKKGFVSLEEFGNTLKCLDFPEEIGSKIKNGVKQSVKEEDDLYRISIGGKFYAIGAVKEGVLTIVARNE